MNAFRTLIGSTGLVLGAGFSATTLFAQTPPCQPGWLPTLTAAGTTYSLRTYDDGSGSALYLGTWGSGVQKWNGTTSTMLGTLEGNVKAMTDLNGKLYAGGTFLKQGGVPLSNDIAMWDGTAWSSLGTGLTSVNALTVFNGAVYAGTGFAGTGAGVSTWNGTSWSTVGSWSHGDVNALTVHNNELYAAAWGSGGWSGTGQDGVVAKWTGSAWSVIGTWVNGQVHALTIFNGDLYAGGYFADPSGVGGHSIAKWNGSSWTELGGLSDGTTYALSVYNDGACSGPALFAGGYFTTVGGVVGTVFGFPAVTGGVAADGIAKWDGSGWSALGNGTPNGTVFALATFADGNGQALYVGGEFNLAGGATANFIAKWKGCPSTPSCVSSWLPSMTGAATTYSLRTYDDGSGSALYLGTWGSGVQKWNGATLTTLGDLEGAVKSMTDLNGKLYAGGIFLKQGGVALGSDIAMWDGTAWSSLGTTLTNGVNALTVFNGAVYAGTGFAGTGAGVSTWNGTSWSTVGSWSHGDVNALTVYNNELYAAAWGSGGWSGTGQDGVVAKWTGSAWSVIGTWVNGQVHALTIFNGDLYAGGYFADPSGVGGHSIAKWNGSSWTELGGLSDGTTYALSVYNDGACSGPALFAGGYFTTVGGVVGTVFGFPAVTGGVAADGIAKWDGSGWSALGNGTPNGTVFALAPYADGNGQALYVGGEFVVAAGAPGEFIAKWGCPSAPAIVAFGTGTPGGNGVQTLGTNGIPKINTSTFAFTCDNAPPSSLGLLLDSNVQDLAGSDPFFIGVQLHVNLMTASEVYAFDIVSDASGNGMTAPIPIPNSPAMIGATYYAQALWLWPSSYTVSPNNLSTSRGLAITVQP